MKRFTAICLTLCLLLVGCTQQDISAGTDEESMSTLPGSSRASAAVDTSQLFSNRDYDTDYTPDATLLLQGDSVSGSGAGFTVDGTTVTITREGTYLLSGTLTDGMILVDTQKEIKVQLVLDGVSIHSETSAPIYIRQGDKVFITLADGSENTLSNGGSFTPIDENNVDAAVFSKEDLTINGSGRLTVTSPGGHGIVSKDELTLTGGTLMITGSIQMAQSITPDGQGVLGISVGSQIGGTPWEIRDSSGKLIISGQPEKAYSCIVVSCPGMKFGETYTVTVGTLSGDLQAS